ncbi:hypothetical protein, partial [Curtobacterium sp. B18]|uniref:hypothetical protein n=1 Tax=Curtobacterium sp. B18 TaxID=95614 RepID=UPI0004CEEE27
TFLRTDEYEDYIRPTEAQCSALSYLNGGTTYYASRPNYDTIDGPGYFCGSNESVAYGTMISKRTSINSYGSIGYDFSDHAQAFVDFQFGYSKLSLFRDVLSWYYETADGNQEGTFFNTPTPLPACGRPDGRSCGTGSTRNRPWSLGQ